MTQNDLKWPKKNDVVVQKSKSVTDGRTDGPTKRVVESRARDFK